MAERSEQELVLAPEGRQQPDHRPRRRLPEQGGLLARDFSREAVVLGPRERISGRSGCLVWRIIGDSAQLKGRL